MENNNINLLDLDNDILNIIGGYVKKDNEERKKEIFNKADKLFKKIKKEYPDNKPYYRRVIIHFFYVNGIENIIIIDEYLTLKKLNLKNKKYSFDDIQNKKEEILDYLNKYINNEKKYLHISLFYY